MKEPSTEKLGEVTELGSREVMGLNPGCLVSELPLSVAMLCDAISKLVCLNMGRSITVGKTSEKPCSVPTRLFF